MSIFLLDLKWMKPILTFVLIFLASNAFCQSIHHQMISSQAESSVVSSDLIVKQTIGQLSIIGSFSGNLVVQRGFQQSYWDNHLNSSNPILVSISPNPFTELIEYSISDLKNEKIAIHIFDVNGKIVYSKEHFVENQSITLKLSKLSNGMYLVKLNKKGFNHFSKIIKK